MSNKTLDKINNLCYNTDVNRTKEVTDMSRLTIEQRKNVPAKQQKRVIQKLLNDKEVINRLTTSEVCLLQEVLKTLDKQAKQQVKDLQFKVNMSEWETNVKKKYSNKDYYDISDVVQKIYSNT